MAPVSVAALLPVADQPSMSMAAAACCRFRVLCTCLQAWAVMQLQAPPAAKPVRLFNRLSTCLQAGSSTPREWATWYNHLPTIQRVLSTPRWHQPQQQMQEQPQITARAQVSSNRASMPRSKRRSTSTAIEELTEMLSPPADDLIRIAFHQY